MVVGMRNLLMLLVLALVLCGESVLGQSVSLAPGRLPYYHLLDSFTYYLEMERPLAALPIIKDFEQTAVALRDTTGLIDASIARGYAAYLLRKSVEALDYYDHALRMAYRRDDSIHISRCHVLKALAYQQQDYSVASLYAFRQAMDFFTPNASVREVLTTYRNVGTLYKEQEQYSEARELYQKALALHQKTGITYGESQLYQEMADLECRQNRRAAAMVCLYKSLQVSDVLRTDSLSGILHSELAVLYQDVGLREYSELHIRMALVEADRSGAVDSRAHVYLRAAQLSKAWGQIDSAERYAQRGLALVRDTDYQNGLCIQLLDLLGAIASVRGDFPSALQYADRAGEIRTQMLEHRKSAEFAQKELDNEFQLRQEEALIRQQDHAMQLAADSVRTRFVVLALSVLIFFTMVSIILMRAKVLQELRTNHELEVKAEKLRNLTQGLQLQKRDLEVQQDEINQNNRLLLESQKLIRQNTQNVHTNIDYVRNIQRSLLVREHDLSQQLGESFVLYWPRDVVSGDFYWYTSTDEGHILAVADCAGHGVPGALMSLIGNILLSKIVKEWHITDPAAILCRLHDQLRSYLSTRGDSYVGYYSMDISLVKIDCAHRRLTHSGASDTMYLRQGGKTLKLRGSIKSVGSVVTGYDFRNTEIPLENDAMLYLTSDGYADQLNADNRKLGRNTFSQLLESLDGMTALEQSRFLQVKFMEHQGNAEQTDDVCLLGIRVKLA